MSRSPATAAAEPRSPEQIRADIERTREELGESVELLRYKVAELTDWRRQLHAHRRKVVAGAVVAGFVVGGGLALLARR